MTVSSPGTSNPHGKLSPSQRSLLVVGGLLLLVVALNLLRPSPYGCGPLLAGRYALPRLTVTAGFALAGGLSIAAAPRLAPHTATRILQAAFMIGFGLGLAMISFEVFQRVAQPLPSMADLKAVNHEMLGIWNEPGVEVDHASPTGEITHHFARDNNGFVVYTPQGNVPPDGARRVMMLGDSFLAGLQVAAEENVSVVLQADLNQSGNGQAYHVLNAGREGFSPLRYLLVYRTFAPDYRPDVVVALVYVGNDFTDDAVLYHGERVIYDQHGEVLALKGEIDLETGQAWASGMGRMEPLAVREHETLWPLRTVEFIRDYFGSRACATLQRAARQRAWPLPPAPQSLAVLSFLDAYERYALRDETLVRNNNLAIFKDAYTSEDVEDIQRSLSYLETLRDEVEADGADFVLVIVPRPGQVSHQSQRGVDPVIDSTAPQDFLMAFCREQAMTCIDLLPVFEEHSDEQLFWQTDVHFAPQGHVLAARVIAPTVLATAP